MHDGARLSPDLHLRWAAARLVAIQQAPYLASALLALEPHVVLLQVPPTGATGPLHAFPVDQRWRVHLDPTRLAATEVPEVAYWLLHQVTHLLRDHGARGARMGVGAPGVRWNVAADLEIGDDLPVRPRPAVALVPERLGLPRHRLAEEYWRALAGRRTDNLFVCGFATHDAGGRPGGISLDESRLLQRETARRVASRARAQGDVPAGWKRWAREVLEPVIDWRHELAAVLRRAVAVASGRIDHTYRLRSRRQASVQGVVLPGLQQPRAAVAVVLDTSQSISQEHLDRSVAELGRIIAASGIARDGVRVICCDTAAHVAGRRLQARSTQLLGGGGTDLRAGLAAAACLRPRPEVVVVLTDGLTEWPEQRPGATAVIVGLLGGRVPTPAWAHVVDIPLGRAEGPGMRKEHHVDDRS